MNISPSEARWYVLRDLKRANALLPGCLQLQQSGIEIFTPMRWVITQRNGKRVRREIPYITDLLFAHATRTELDPLIDTTPTLQYRYARGLGYRMPMTVRTDDMNRFITAVRATDNPRYYLPEELTPELCGRYIRIIGGPLDGYEGNLLSLRGSRKRRLLVHLPNLLTAAVEVNPEFIQFISKT